VERVGELVLEIGKWIEYLTEFAVTGVMQRGFFGTIFHNIKYKATKSLEAFEVEAHGGGASRRGRKSKPSALTVY
jgi:hypothetical protein